jgi:hypothetical protein
MSIPKYKSRLLESEGLFIYDFVKFKGEWLKTNLLKAFKGTNYALSNIKIEITGTVELTFTLASGREVKMDMVLKIDDAKGKVNLSFYASSEAWEVAKEANEDYPISNLDYRTLKDFVLKGLSNEQVQ